MAIEMNNVAPPMPACWRKETKTHKFCPGCGHGIVLKALGEAVDELGIQEKVIFSVDIGCCLLAIDFFNMDTVQTHHGRTNAGASGVKRATPDKICIAYMGDGGGYAIGSQHLLNAAARNEKITSILVNNTNYGMTGGQMAPTTLPGQKTETSPYGRSVEQQGSPTHGPEMLAAMLPEGAYVARGTVANPKQLKKYLKKALQAQINGTGFSFVEALSTCPTNWSTNAAKTWDFLENQMAVEIPVGEYKVPQEGGNE